MKDAFLSPFGEFETSTGLIAPTTMPAAGANIEICRRAGFWESFLIGQVLLCIMRISDELKQALDSQVRLESATSNAYLAMASWSESTGYEGAAAYFYAQSDEERTHMIKIIHYLNDVGAPAAIPAIGEPARSFESLEDVIKASLENERAVTKAIQSMVAIAQKDGDYATRTFLEWFVTEQAHEETKFELILQKFDLIGRDKIALYEIDKILSTSAATPDLGSA